MRVSRRRRAGIVLAFVSACLVAPAGLAGVQAAANPITLSVHVGYRSMVKLGSWMPVTIDATNTGADLDGTLEVQGRFVAQGGPPAFAVYEMPISLARGATKHLRTYIVEDQPGLTITARIVRGGQIVATQDAPNSNQANLLIGVLSDQPTAFDSFAAVHPGGINAGVAHLSLDQLSDSALVLGGFDLLAIDDFATDTLTAGQRTAISDYVQNGGALIIGTGAAWHKTLGGLPSGILPMAMSGTTTLASSQALGGLDGVEAATGTNNGGHAWLTEGDRPLMVERTIGTGLVTMAAFDWNQEPIVGWSGTNTLLRQVLVRTALGVGSNQNFAMNLNGGSSISQRGNQLTGSLGNLPALDLPSLTLTGVLVLLYVLLVGPVNYLVLRALNRRALAWITAPLIAVVAAGGAYGGGLLTKGRSVQANQISIIHVQPGWDRAYEETYTGVMTPTRGDYQASVGGGQVLISPLYSYNGPYGTSSQGVIRVNLDSGAVGLPGMTAFTLRGFAAESLTAAPNLTANVRLVNGQLTGTVQNHSSTDFTDAVLIAGDGFQKLGPLRAGASIDVSVIPKVSNPYGGGGPPAYTTIYPNYTFTQGPPPNQASDALREGETRTQILAMLSQGGGYKGIAAPVVPLLVAWTKQSFQPITVNGSQPRSYSETAVAVQLPVDQIGAGPVPAGLVVGRMVDVDGDSQPGPPGGVSMTNGSVTYAFMPNLVPGTRLVSASLSSSNPFFGKGIPPTANGSQPSLTTQIWDWSHSAWADLAYRDNATNAIPDTAVNPSTGEVRVKMTVANGGYLSGGISLTGTVQ